MLLTRTSKVNYWVPTARAMLVSSKNSSLLIPRPRFCEHK
jgi:hypothetical protein